MPVQESWCKMVVLGIETSCDETSAAVVADGRNVLSNVVHTQAEHAEYGGVVPEIASRCHVLLLPGIVNRAVHDSGLNWSEIDAVAATRGPGLASSLLVGWSFAKGLAFRLGKPLAAVNHIEAHIHSVFLDPSAPSPHDALPMAALAVSGGHSNLFRIERYGEIQLLGRSVDDAAGEALDKAAKLLGLGYPGGPVIDRISKTIPDPDGKSFPEGRLSDDTDTGGLDPNMCFSFSGLKTSLLYYLKSNPPQNSAETAKIAADYQEAVVTALAKRCEAASKGAKYLAVGGGVSLNSRLRHVLAERCSATGVKLLLAPPAFCGDNAAMIAGLAGMGRGIWSPDSFSIDVAPSWPADTCSGRAGR